MADDRYPWEVRVTDRDGRLRLVGVGAEDGEVIFEAPTRFHCGPDDSDFLVFAVKAAADRARAQRRANPR